MIDPKKQRTQQQNRALHKWFELLADELNSAGLDQRKVLKPSISIPWAKQSVKEQLWRPIQKALFEKKSTTELLKQEEIDKIFDVINKHLGERFGLEVPHFPSLEEMDLFKVNSKKYDSKKPRN